nr:Glucuronide permease [Citrobacter werkmanii]
MAFSVLVFCVPAEWSHSSKVIYAYITYMGLGICYSLVNIPYGSLATAMTQQPQSRARLGAARSIAASLTFVCPAFLIGPRISGASPTEMQDVYLFWTIIPQLQVLCCISSVLNRPKKMSCVSWRSLR